MNPFRRRVTPTVTRRNLLYRAIRGTFSGERIYLLDKNARKWYNVANEAEIGREQRNEWCNKA
jgi:hypothetical protein